MSVLICLVYWISGNGEPEKTTRRHIILYNENTKGIMRVTRNGKSGLNQRLLCSTGYRIVKYNAPFLLCIITKCTIFNIIM